jgi:hypothetical protein
MIHGEWGETLNEMFERYIRVLETYRVKKCSTNRCSLVVCEAWHHDKEKRRSAWDSNGNCSDLFDNKTSTSYTPMKFKTERCKCVTCPFGKNCSFAHKGEPLLPRRPTPPTKNKWVMETWELFAIMESKMSNPTHIASDDFPKLGRSMGKRQRTDFRKTIAPPGHSRPTALKQHSQQVTVYMPEEPAIRCLPSNTKTINLSNYHSNALSLNKGLVETLNGLLEILCDYVMVKASVIEYRARGMDYQLERLARTRINSFLGDFGEEYESTHRVWCSSQNNQISVMRAIDRDDQQAIFKFKDRANAHAANISGMILIRVLRSSKDHEKATFEVVNNLLTYTSSVM